MAISSVPVIKLPSFPLLSSPPSPNFPFLSPPPSRSLSNYYKSFASYRFPPGRRSIVDDDDEDASNCGGSFKEAVELFNRRDYHGCHDFLETLWNKSQEPIRTLVHGILQCAVGFHHLFNQNHKGAMMEMGEGLCKLRKLNLSSGPFHQFEIEISAVLDFIYQTQLEFAACTDDLCLALDQSERSYKLLGGYAAGQQLYCLESDDDETLYIVFCPDRSYVVGQQPRVRLPILGASEEHLMELEYN